MTVATDTFAQFVDTLVDVLDDHEAHGWATGDELALRLHFSRFHFDRMIKSVAGEPPSAFRRRILLERAAYRMITTRAPLIDIAVEAGYGSHEAFTRAFKQAYGATPAAWRKKPGHLQIPAPSGVHFHPPGSIRLPARDKVTPMELLTKMVEHHIWLTGEMVRLAERLTDEQLDEEIELNVDDDRQTIRSLLSRLIGQMGMWNAAMATRDYDWSVEEHESLSSMRERLAVEGPTYLTHVRDVADARPRRRHVRRRAVRAGRGVHLRRDDRPRPHLRRPPAHARRARVRQARRRGARLGRPDALGRRARLTPTTDSSATPSGKSRSEPQTNRVLGRLGHNGRRGDRGPARRPWPSPCWRSPPWPTASTSRRRCC